MAGTVPVYIVAGQSNANNPMLVKAIEAEAAANGGIVIHVAVNGTSLDPSLDIYGSGDWSATDAEGAGELLDALIVEVAAALSDLNGEGYVAGMIWVQGEADTWSASAASAYADALLALHETLVAEFGPHDMVISSLSDRGQSMQNYGEKHSANWDTVQAAQEAVAAASDTIHIVYPDEVADEMGISNSDMFFSDGIHYRHKFADDLGRALFDRLMAELPVTLDLANSLETRDRAEKPLIQKAADAVVVADKSAAVAVAVTETGKVLVADDEVVDQASVEGVSAVVTGWGSDVVQIGGAVRKAVTGHGDDVVTGSDTDDRIFTGAGNDRADGGGGNDDIRGGAGHDTLNGGDGNDKIFGQSGDDLISGDAGNDILGGGAGNDTINGGIGDDRIVGNAGKDLLYGGDGNDIILGGSENDKIDGGAGNDMVNGGWGDDVVSGGDGNDTVKGAVGNDTLDGGNGDDIILGGTGDDLMTGGAGHDRLMGHAGNDVIYGGEGDDSLFGHDGNDQLYGGAGADLLRGGDGQDALFGEDGDDVIEGGLGDDLLSGGAGRDIFVLKGGDGADVITDFEVGLDVLSFSTDAEVTLEATDEGVLVAYSDAFGTGTVLLAGVEQIEGVL